MPSFKINSHRMRGEKKKKKELKELNVWMGRVIQKPRVVNE